MAAGAFLGNEMVQDAVVRNFEIIGEASRNIDRRYPEFVSAHPGLALREAYAMRNQLAHHYANIDMQIVWDTIVGDLPDLKASAQEARRTVPDD